ncbi:unnamed protein product, partial [marine sediment metagenome]
LQAAELFHKAGFLSEEFAKDNDIGSINSIQSKIFSSYYYYEEHNCFAQYYYEKHNIDKAKEHNKESLNFLEGSIKLTEENIKSLTSQIKEQLSDHLKICKYYKITSIAFFPDTLEEAHRQGYENCRSCIGERAFRFKTKLIIEEEEDNVRKGNI